jgi:hypothetical protein
MNLLPAVRRGWEDMPAICLSSAETAFSAKAPYLKWAAP